MDHTPTTGQGWKRIIAGSFVVLSLLSLVGGLATPQPVHAQSEVEGPSVNAEVGIPVSRPGEVSQGVVDFVTNGLVTAARLGIKNALRSFLEKLAYDTAVWIGSGGEGQTPLIFTSDAGEYIAEASDAAVGEYLNTLASENGFLDLNLCELSAPESIQFQVFIPQLLGKEPYKPSCTMSEIGQNFEQIGADLTTRAAILMDDPRALVKISRSFDPGENYMSSLLTGLDQAIDAQLTEEERARLEREKSDFRDQKARVSGYIQTPAATVESQVNTTLNKSTEGETIQQGNIIADALSVFFNTLASKLTDRLASGLLTFFTETDINDSLSGGSSIGGSASGIRGAQEQFANFQTPSFTSGGTVDILTSFANCPGGNQGLDVTNCVVNEGMRSAIEEKLTLQQAVDQGRIDGQWKFGTFMNQDNPELSLQDGIPLRNIKILKQYSVVPVGWVLAAEYNREFDGTSLSIQQIMDDFGNCSTDNYSPYCGLVDPDWVLVAPEVFCKVEGFGEVQATPDEFIDLDGNEYTPQEQLVTRLNTCVDFQTCLTENDSGQCEGGHYGYCVEQRDIYRFEGEQCPAHFTSCETFNDDEGNEVSYLKNSLNFNDCTADNAGCQWNCGVYNSVDQAYQCASQTEIFTTCTDAAGCACTAGPETCTIVEGGFQCETANNGFCQLGIEAETVSGVDAAITFDGDVRTCDSGDAGCTQVYSVKGEGSNLLFNASFEQFNAYKEVDANALNDLGLPSDTAATSPYDDTFGFWGAQGDGVDTALAGEPCSVPNYPAGAPCYGWGMFEGGEARAVSTALDGSVGLQLRDVFSAGGNLGWISGYFDTGRSVANRTFVLSYSYSNDSAASCTGFAGINLGSSTNPIVHATVEYQQTTGFVTVEDVVVTIEDTLITGSETALRAEISMAEGCSVVVDQVKLEEVSPEIGLSGSTGFSSYGSTSFGLNINQAPSCTPEEVGCQLFIPETGESDLDIPGQITNPLSTACTGIAGLTNPLCSQCLEEFVGCEAYFETPTVNQAPINDGTGFANFNTAGFDATLAAGIAQRTGYFCEGTDTSCSPTRATLDCGSGTACLPSVSITPSTGESCSAASVGCEEYVNLDEQSSGGEGLEYYTYIRQCVTPTFTTQNQDDIATYYTFEGSDQSGYQIRSWNLKKSDIRDAGNNGAPCTNLDLYGPTSQTPEANCVDTTLGSQTCSALDVGVNPDCTEYFDGAGNVYYLLRSQTITVSDSCQALRNSLDARLYYTIPAESTSCPASENLCREYQGSEAGNAETILEDNFDAGAWDGGESSATVVTANAGLSMALGDGTANSSSFAAASLGSDIQVNKTYVMTFWAKSDSPGTTAEAFINSPTSGIIASLDPNGIVLTDEWKPFTIGPFVYEGPIIGDEQIALQFTGGVGDIAYFDNVQLQRSENQYLIANSADGCFGYEGCEQYSDQSGNTHFLKSFSNLCSEDVLGCQAVVNTNNNNSPYYEHYNTSNNGRPDGELDDVIVGVDETVTYAVVNEALCDQGVAGCGFFGEPLLDAADNITGYNERYLVNDPDEYDTTLCQEQSRACEIYNASDGTQFFFKDPGEKVCSYDASIGEWVTPDGDSCPVRNASVSPSQPIGPVCNGGERVGLLCSADSQCPSAPGDTNTYSCDSNIDANSGWVGQCTSNFAGCTLYTDPNTENLIDNGNFETDVRDNQDITSADSDNKPDRWIDYADPLDINPVDVPTGYQAAVGKTLVLCENLSANGYFELADDIVFEGAKSLKISRGSTSTSNVCLVGPEGSIPVDENRRYTLSGDVYVQSTAQRFAIGLHYYDADGNEIVEKTPGGQLLETEDYAIAAWEGTNRGSTAGLIDQWNRYHATIGPNLANEFPVGTAFVRPFVESGTNGGGTRFDNVKFTENQGYSYINNTVDGAPESDENTCAGAVDAGQGCVALRDSASSSLNELSEIEAHRANDPAYAVQSCVYNGVDGGTACRSVANAADTNRVIKVRRDRECAAWLSCATGVPTDTDGDGEFDDVTCLDVGLCDQRNPDTGECTSYAEQKFVDSLGSADDRTIQHLPGDARGPLSVSHASGYTNVGGTWVGACLAGTCVGGQSSGSSCTLPSDCSDAYVTFGHYPYDWSVQRGLGTSGAVTDVVSGGDFEDVFCTGVSQYGTDGEDDHFPDIDGDGDADLPASVERAKDRSQSCTLDRHCRSIKAETQLEVLAQERDGADDFRYPDLASVENTAEVYYERGWCENVDESTQQWGSWSAIGDAELEIVDYDRDRTYATNEFQAVPADPSTGSISALNLDLNNVMYVQPENDDQNGVSVNLSDSIQQGQEYTLSFDAAYTQSFDPSRDIIRVGLQHGSNAEDTDYFAGGSAAADIVFVVDASGSMAAEITNVATGLNNLITGLADNGVDYQIGIVTTQFASGPYVLDFDDYTASFFGGNNGITTPFTTDSGVASAALTHIAANLDGGAEQNYEALVDIATNEFGTDTGFEYPFRDEASKFVVLLTDEAPDGSDPNVANTSWEAQDEIAMMNGGLPPEPYALYSIVPTTGDAFDAYDELSYDLGGEVYNLDLADYSPILSDISTQIVRQSLDFRFTTVFEQYNLGPITIENKEDLESITSLFIVQASGSTNTPFVIDNVSMRPTLEVSKENNPHSSTSTDLINRDCRAYPESDSRSCNYTEDNGTIYSGWKGYCLEHDELDPVKCVAWWPVDVIAGEPGLFPDAVPVNYQGLIPSYHCLVAKGNESIGVCVDSGDIQNGGSRAICSGQGADSCPNAGEICLGQEIAPSANRYETTQFRGLEDCSLCEDAAGASNSSTSCNATSLGLCVNLAEVYNESTDDIEHTILSGDVQTTTHPGYYKVEHQIDKLHVDPLGHGNRYPNVGQPAPPDTAQGADTEWATFQRIDPSPLEQQIHISEIDNITFDYGDPQYGLPWWSVPNDQIASDVNELWKYGAGNFNSRDLEVGFWKSNSSTSSSTINFDDASVGQETEERTPSTAYQYGWWCNDDPGTDGLCNEDNIPTTIDDADFIITRNIGVQETSPSFDITATPFNPFNGVYELGDPSNLVLEPDDPIWNSSGEISGTAVSGAQKMVTSDGTLHTLSGINNLFGTRDDGGPGCFNSAAAGNDCGWNTMAIKFNFEDGYLEGVYLIYWDGFTRADVDWIEDIGWTFDLREPCLLAVESSRIQDDQVIAHPWQTRVQPDSGYATFEVGYSFDTEGNGVTINGGFGAIGFDDNTLEPHELDGLEYDTSGEVTAGASNNLPFAYPLEGNGTTAPFACIGDCGSNVCDDNRGIDGPLNNSSCTDSRFVGMPGICRYGDAAGPELSGEVYVDDDNESHICTQSGDCPTGSLTFCSTTAGDAAGLEPNTTGVDSVYEEQLKKAAATAWTRYRQLFVDVEAVWYAPRDDDDSNRHFGSFMSVNEAQQPCEPGSCTFEDFGLTTADDVLTVPDFLDADGDDEYDYYNMPQCTSIDRDNGEYCYFKPDVDNIAINGNAAGDIAVASGTAVALTFDSVVNPDQEPLQFISIDWRAPDAAEDFDENGDVLFPIPWGGASTPGHVFTNVYTCDPVFDSAFWDGTTCNYRPKIQIQDAWTSCSGDISGDGVNDTTRSAGTTGGCTSYDQYNGVVRVSP